MKLLLQYFIKHHKVTNMIMILLILSGLFSLSILKREQFPEISFDVIQIKTIYPGASPEDVELHVTEKIETRLLEVENIKKMTSLSFENISLITIEIDGENGNPTEIKQNINDAVSRVNDLPTSITEDPVIEVALSGGSSELELRKYARNLEDKFNEVSGISRVIKTGYRKRELHIEADAKKLTSNSVSINEIVNAVASRNVRQSGGTLKSYVSEKKIVTLSEYSDLSQVNNVIVRSNSLGYNLKLSDIAEVTDSFEDPLILYRGNGKPAIGLSVLLQGNSDIIDISTELKEKLKLFQNTLPDNINADLISDYSIFTDIMLKMMITNGTIGFILVLLILFLFLDLKSGFWCAYGIPFSIIVLSPHKY